MSKSKKLKLIEGEFPFREAKEILFNIFYTKINFHQRNNFSSKERFGKEDSLAKKRIPALKKELVKLEKVFQQAETENKKLIIDGEIRIWLAKEN